MTTERFTVRYARDGDRMRYVHTVETELGAASDRADRWLAGNGWGGWTEGQLRVWVEDASGQVVHGQAAAPHEEG